MAHSETRANAPSNNIITHVSRLEQLTKMTSPGVVTNSTPFSAPRLMLVYTTDDLAGGVQKP